MNVDMVDLREAELLLEEASVLERLNTMNANVLRMTALVSAGRGSQETLVEMRQRYDALKVHFNKIDHELHQLQGG